jgi:hypothetical protein
MGIPHEMSKDSASANNNTRRRSRGMDLRRGHGPTSPKMGQIASGQRRHHSRIGNQTKRSENQTIEEEMIWIMEFDQFPCKPGTNHQEMQESTPQKKRHRGKNKSSEG